MNKLLYILFLTCLWLPSNGQKFLQLEKSGSLNSPRMYIGDVLTFQLKNDDTGWYTRDILDFDVSRNRIIFHAYELPLDSISVIRIKRNNVMQIVGGALQGGGVNMILFSTYYSVFRDRPTDWSTVLFGVANIGIGTALRKLFRTKRFKPGKRKRLRLLDVSFGPPVPASKS